MKSRELIVESKANKLVLDGKDLKLSNKEKAKLNPISSLNKVSNQNNKENTNISSININNINYQNKNSFYESSIITELSKGLLTKQPLKNQNTQVERTSDPIAINTTNIPNVKTISQNSKELQANNPSSSTQPANKLNQSNNNISIINKSFFNFDKDDVEIKKQEQKSEMLFSSIIKDQFKHEFHEIYDFMEGLGLSQFTNNFIKRGVTTIDKVLSKYYLELIHFLLLLRLR